MNSSTRNTARTAWAALRMVLVMTLATGVLYPLAVTGLAQGLWPHQANGSPVRAEGRQVGSELVGQRWNLPGTDRPDPRWFQPRPSHGDHDPEATGSSQLGPSDPTLTRRVERTRRAVAAFNQVPASTVPPDAVTGSSSGIDPHISPAYARLQVDRVARHQHLPRERVARLVADHTEGRTAGFLGQPHVNVLRLNLAVRAATSG
ncbi:potassium-transporting ATPase subunit KdpC [Streptomyces sp. NPDC005438]|uniref:potassium-transporting ATPase subunit KdpC n=1 Tax=Streptomyces sp. NPDC005438 TaxID=3156880 RepID=UPI0033BBABFF